MTHPEYFFSHEDENAGASVPSLILDARKKHTKVVVPIQIPVIKSDLVSLATSVNVALVETN